MPVGAQLVDVRHLEHDEGCEEEHQRNLPVLQQGVDAHCADHQAHHYAQSHRHDEPEVLQKLAADVCHIGYQTLVDAEDHRDNPAAGPGHH